MQESFTYSYKVTYGDVDAQKVTYNGRYLDIVDDFTFHFLAHTIKPLNDKLGYRLKRVTIDYLSPSHLGDDIHVAVDASKSRTLGNSSSIAVGVRGLALSLSVNDKAVSTVDLALEIYVPSESK